jgi:tripartite-type tricarboxylate transporter receptor subunit TctC
MKAIAKCRGMFLISVMALLCVGTASAQYPTKAVRVIIPYAAGGATDVVGRKVFEKVQISLKQPFIVENRPSTNATIGVDAVVRAAPDGYTVLYGAVGTQIPALLNNLPFDALRDLEPVAITTIGAIALILDGQKFKSLQDFVAYAKANPGKINFGQGQTAALLAMSLLQKEAGIQVAFIPYKGSGAARTAFLAGEVDAVFDALSGFDAMIASGKARPVMFIGTKRTSLAPNLPTSAEAGYPTVRNLYSHNVWLPKGSPAEAVTVLNRAINASVQAPDVGDLMRRNGSEPATGTPQEMVAHVKMEMEIHTQGARAANFKPAD